MRGKTGNYKKNLRRRPESDDDDPDEREEQWSELHTGLICEGNIGESSVTHMHTPSRNVDNGFQRRNASDQYRVGSQSDLAPQVTFD